MKYNLKDQAVDATESDNIEEKIASNKEGKSDKDIRTVEGRVSEPEKRTSEKSGIEYITVNLAENKAIRCDDNSIKRTTNWYRLICFEDIADLFLEEVKKGYKITVTGAYQQDEWTDEKTGKTGITDTIIVDEFNVLIKPVESLSTSEEGGEDDKAQ